jgi:hypothetical protein
VREARDRRPTAALIVAMIALVAAMSGAAMALPGKNSVNSGDIKDATVKNKDIKRDAVRSKHVKGRSLKGTDVQDDALKGKQIFEDKLEAVPEAKAVQTVTPFGEALERTTATEAATEAAARAAAPRVPLASRGQLTVYGKCYRDTTADTVFAAVFVESSADGAIYESGANQLEGSGGFLNAGTPEADRALLVASAAADASALDRAGWSAMAPDGTGIGGEVAAAAKNGTVAEGSGVFGDGNVCLFDGSAIG